MDIKTRIDTLTEAEAKAALARCLEIMEKCIRCYDCWHYKTVDVCPTPWNCQETWLNEALKELRK